MLPSLLETIARRAREAPDAPFARAADGRAICSYATLHDGALRLASLLDEHKVKPGGRVALATERHWAMLALLAACARRGAILVPMNPRLHSAERDHILDDASPRFVIVDEQEGKSWFDLRVPAIALSAALSSRAVVPSEPDGHAASGDVCVLMYTSGTTGHGKAVMLSEENLVRNAIAIARCYGVRADDRVLSVMPVHHMNGLMIGGCMALVSGASVVHTDFADHELWHRVADSKATIGSVVPPTLGALLKTAGDGTTPDRSSLRFLLCGAGPLPADVWQRFEETFAVSVHQGYGLTETTCWATLTPPDAPRRYATVGVPIDCEIRIDRSVAMQGGLLNDRRRGLRDDEPPERRGENPLGEIQIRGPILMKGYYRKDRLTRSQLTADGFFKTGDIGFFDAERHLQVCGRIKEVVFRRGVTILPEEVDEIVARHPAIAASKTVGVRDDTLGEEVVTVCVAKDPAHAPPSDEVCAFVNKQLSSFRALDRVVWLPFLPRGAAGKVSSHELQALLSGATAEQMFRRLNSHQYRRAQPDDPGAIKQLLQDGLVHGTGARFVTYWGCGRRDAPNTIDEIALRRLREFVNEASYPPYVRSSLVLVLADIHVAINGKPTDRVRRYFDAIEEHARELGMDVVTLSRVWEAAGASVERVLASADRVWAALDAPSREGLVNRAGKHGEDGDAVAAAKGYAAACLAEGPLVAAHFAGSIFLTYNGPEAAFLMPPLPRMYLFSYHKGRAEKPWFTAADDHRAG